jgi:transglutaminase/protease-like cytokinesis protein 3
VIKYLLVILLSAYCIRVTAQEDPAALTISLVKNCRTEKEKVNAIFRWITENISYKIITRQKTNNTSSYSARMAKAPAQEAEPDTAALKPLAERVSLEVLQSGVAVCDGYAKLFATMCSYAGIRSEIIVGYARGNPNKPISKPGVNHYWNAVFFDGKWHLTDVTWASGYIDLHKNKFVREYDGKYFLSDPEVFINDHYPDDLRWTLLPDSKIPNEFRHAPFRHRSFIKYNIISYNPAAGIIKAARGDTVSISIEMDIAKDRKIARSELTDSSIFSYSSSWKFLKPDKTEQEDTGKQRSVYTFVVNSTEIKWLFLVYNDDLILRYNVNVSEAKPDVLTASL